MSHSELTARSQRRTSARVDPERMSANDPRDEPLHWNYPPQPAQPTNATDVLPENNDAPVWPASPRSAWSSSSAPSYGAPSYDAPSYGTPAYGQPAYQPPTYPTEPLAPLGPPPTQPPYGSGPQRPRAGPVRRGAARSRPARCWSPWPSVAVSRGRSSPATTATKTVVSAQSPVNVTGSGAPTETLAKVAAAVQPSVVSITVDARTLR